MVRVAKFLKIDEFVFKKDLDEIINLHPMLEDMISVSFDLFSEIYNNIKLPVRQSNDTAIYNFFSPFGFILPPGETVIIPTGIKCEMDYDWILAVLPRNDYGANFRLQFDSTVQIIDKAYEHSNRKGHIFFKFTNDNHNARPIIIKKGDICAQGLFVPFGITVDDVLENK